MQNLARDSVYGLVWRVGVGALLSSVDAATDIYVVVTYYSEGLNTQANAMLGMISANLFLQILVVFVQYRKKRLIVKLREVLICLLFVRPIVDAFRISTNHEEEDSLLLFRREVESAANKVRDCSRV